MIAACLAGKSAMHFCSADADLAGQCQKEEIRIRQLQGPLAGSDQRVLEVPREVI